MIARIRLIAAAALLAVAAFFSNLRSTIAARLPVSTDRAIADLNGVVGKLNRVVTQQDAAVEREIAFQEASYVREDTASAAAERAARVRDRVQALLA